jgi:hypothetical protein
MNPRDLIDHLGTKTINEIHDLCLAKGYKGEAGKPRRCPTAVLIKNETGFTVSVGSDDIDWTDNGNYLRYAPVPDSLRDFIELVDAGEYPELILPATPDRQEAWIRPKTSVC